MIIDTKSAITLLSVVSWMVVSCSAGGGSNAVHIGADVPKALVVLSDYQAGSYSIVDVDRLVSKNLVQVVYQDTVCRYDSVTRRMYLIERLGADALMAVSENEPFHVEWEYAVAPPKGSNPQDVACSSENACYVPLYQAPFVVKLDPENGHREGTIDLSAYADQDGIPEAAWIVHENRRIFVALQRLDSRDSFVPTDYSVLVVIDTATDQVEAALELAAENPFGKMRYSRAVERLVIPEAGAFGVMDGGVELIDPETLESDGLVIDESALGGDVVDAVIASEHKGYAVVAVPRGGGVSDTEVVSFDPSTGRTENVLVGPAGWRHSFLELEPGGDRLWITERSRELNGVRIFRTTDDSELTDRPLQLGLAPFMACFFQDGFERE